MRKILICLCALSLLFELGANAFEILHESKFPIEEDTPPFAHWSSSEVAVNDNDDILVSNRYHSYISDENSNLQVLYKYPLGSQENHKNPFDHYYFRKININNMLIGLDLQESLPVFWTLEKGTQEVFLRSYIPNAQSLKVHFVDINGRNEILGSFSLASSFVHKEEIFIYKDGYAHALNLDEDLSKYSKYYTATPISINDDGYTLGSIWFPRHMEEKLPSCILFLKKDSIFQPIEILIDGKNASHHNSVVKMNNKNQILINFNNNTYIWNERNGCRLIAEQFKGIDINDSGEVIGVKLCRDSYLPIYSVPTKPEFILVNDKGNFNISEFFTPMHVQVFDVALNNAGHIAVVGRKEKNCKDSDDSFFTFPSFDKVCYLIKN